MKRERNESMSGQEREEAKSRNRNLFLFSTYFVVVIYQTGKSTRRKIKLARHSSRAHIMPGQLS